MRTRFLTAYRIVWRRIHREVILWQGEWFSDLPVMAKAITFTTMTAEVLLLERFGMRIAAGIHEHGAYFAIVGGGCDDIEAYHAGGGDLY